MQQLFYTDRRREKCVSWMYKRSEEYLHENLREEVLHKFDGKCSERILVKYLLKTAAALENMKIYRNSQIYLGNRRWEKQPSFVTREKLSRRIRKSFCNIGLTKIQLLVF